MIWDFIVKNKVVFIIGAISLVAGFLLNKWANKISEDRIVDRLVSEIKKIKC